MPMTDTNPTTPINPTDRVPLAEALLRKVRERIVDAEWYGANASVLAMLRRQEADLMEVLSRGEAHAPDF